jgi:hypothetical protein
LACILRPLTGPDSTDAVKRILGGLMNIAAGLGELRNRGYGTGHGPGASESAFGPGTLGWPSTPLWHGAASCSTRWPMLRRPGGRVASSHPSRRGSRGQAGGPLPKLSGRGCPADGLLSSRDKRLCAIAGKADLPRCGGQAASVCGAGRAGRAPDDEPWREHHLPGRRTSLIQPLNGGRHGVLGLLLRVLADGGQVHVCQPGQWAIVVPHDRDRPWHVDAGSVERVRSPTAQRSLNVSTAVGSSGWPSNAAAARRPDSSEWFPGMT